MSERARADRSAALLGWLAAFAIGAIGLAVAAAAVSASGAFDEEPPSAAPIGTNLPRPPIRPARAPSVAHEKPPEEGAVEAMREHAPEAMRDVPADPMREVVEEPAREAASERTKRRARRARSMR